MMTINHNILKFIVDKNSIVYCHAEELAHETSLRDKESCHMRNVCKTTKM